MNAFTTHPSVRIKSTENNYEPTQCVNPNCPQRTPHMHCPFCVSTDSYHDPVILKAHYRVKHVDKGIDFAGLKILRCCDHCDIVGTIKGTKEFKGAHWHCYRCKNGFNRRDEAIKHYRTHFRNPQTTFQIQIAQEVNKDNFETADAANTITHIAQDENHEGVVSTSPLANTTYTSVHQADGTQVNGKEGEIQVSVAANETVGAEGQTIMIIQADEHLDAAQVQNAINNANIQEVANIEQMDTVHHQIDHFEEIPATPHYKKMHHGIYKESVGKENLNRNNNNCNTSMVQVAIYNEEPTIISELKPQNNEKVELEVEEAQAVKEDEQSADGTVKSLRRDQHNYDYNIMPYGYNPFYSYAGYFPPSTHTKPSSSTNDEYEKNIKRNVIPSSVENTHKYPYNSEFRSNRRKQRTSRNPLIAAYQQQNVNIPKGHLQYTNVVEAEKSKWEHKITELQQKLNKVESEHREKEQMLKAEISVLKGKVHSQSTVITALQRREQELLAQLSIPLDNQIQELLGQLKSQHEELLHQQLAQVRRSYIQQFGQQTISITTDKASDSVYPSNMVFVQSPGGGSIRLVEEGSTCELTEGSVSTGRIVIMKSEDIENRSDGDREEQITEIVDNTSSELVVTTETTDSANMEAEIETNEVENTSEITVFETMNNETAVQVTLPASAQPADTTEKISEQSSEKPTTNPPRVKRRKKSSH